MTLQEAESIEQFSRFSFFTSFLSLFSFHSSLFKLVAIPLQRKLMTCLCNCAPFISSERLVCTWNWDRESCQRKTNYFLGAKAITRLYLFSNHAVVKWQGMLAFSSTKKASNLSLLVESSSRLNWNREYLKDQTLHALKITKSKHCWSKKKSETISRTTF